MLISYSRIVKWSFAACGLALLLTAETGAQRMTPAVHPTDIRYKTKVTQRGHTTESTTLIKGQRKRTGSMLLQCDLKRELMISDTTRKYFIIPLFKDEARPTPPKTSSASPRVPPR